jgi:SAM-dependent methyltransferase
MDGRATSDVAGAREAAPLFRNLLYRRPELYEVVFPDADETTATMVRTAIARYLAAPPRSLLDVGCGSGQHLATLARTIPDCWGIDLLASNIAYARATRPGIRFEVGDMRSLRLGRRFDVVTCLGNAFSYALTDDELAATVTTFAAHAADGALLILDALNARAYLEGDGFQDRLEGSVDMPEFRARSVSRHRLDRETRILTRARIWHLEGEPEVEDYAEYRLLFPDEVTALLERGGFDVLAMYDNRHLVPTDLTGTITAAPDVSGLRGRKLYVFARKQRVTEAPRPPAAAATAGS